MLILRKTIILLLLCITLSCASQESQYIKDGDQYGVTSGLFRHRWWNYYERGVSFGEGGFYKEAMNDFKEAVKQRGYDKWMARTYGMHFQDYFPHRELGIQYFKIGKIDDAIKELESSLSTAKSARACYFLNKSRKARLEDNRSDTLPPVLELSPLPLVTNSLTVKIEGVASDDHYVSSLSINKRPLFIELAKKRYPFSGNLQLQEGLNSIEIKAGDLSGKTILKTFRIYGDRQGPIINIEELYTKEGKLVIEGYIYDKSEVTGLTIENRTVDIVPAKEIDFKEEFPLPEGSDDIVLTAMDRAGNMTVAETGLHEEVSIFETWPLFAGKNDLFALGIGSILDKNPPVITLKQLFDDIEIYDDKLFIEGKATDDNRIESLKINDEEILKRSGKTIFFSHMIALGKGNNRIIITVRDKGGNRSVKEFSIRRKVQSVRKGTSRMSVALMPFERKGTGTVTGDAVYDNLISSFVEDGRFKVVERSKIDEVLNELKLSSTELVDRSSAVKTGRILGAESIITGSIIEKESSIEVIARMVDTETSAILTANDVFEEDKSLPVVKTLMDGLAYKFSRDFPLSEGIVIKKDGNSIYIDLGIDSKIKEGIKFIIYRTGPEIIHPLTGKSLGAESVDLGEARLKDIYKEFSVALISEKGEDVKIKDKVIAK